MTSPYPANLWTLDREHAKVTHEIIKLVKEEEHSVQLYAPTDFMVLALLLNFSTFTVYFGSTATDRSVVDAKQVCW